MPLWWKLILLDRMLDLHEQGKHKLLNKSLSYYKNVSRECQGVNIGVHFVQKKKILYCYLVTNKTQINHLVVLCKQNIKRILYVIAHF